MRFVLLAALISGPNAFAWNSHQDILDRILLEPEAGLRSYLSIRIPVPCQEEERKELVSLGARIFFTASKVPLLSKKPCGSGKPETLSVAELIGAGVVDEPDLGMDQDLPDEADPRGDRKWMGGKTGPTSQGFRHMVFPGIEWGSPIRTLQIPFSAVGAAFERIETLREVSNAYLKGGNFFFGIRTLLWREHLIQDLLQPFHSTQVPEIRMLPWKDLFSGFVARSSHAIANYHYAYEGLALAMVKSPDERGVQECFKGAAARAYAGASEHLKLGRSKAAPVGSALFSIFGDYLKSKSVNLPEGVGQIDYYELLNARSESLEAEELKLTDASERSAIARNEQVLEGVKTLRSETCSLMHELTSVFWGDLDQALQGMSSSSKTGK